MWGSSVYILNKRISDGNKIPRWKSRSQRCINLGFAKSYASSVRLVLNPNTGTITPQFHCGFNDWFTTITSDVSVLPDFVSASWYNMFGDSHYQYVLDEEDVTHLRELDQELQDSYDHSDSDRAREPVLEAIDHSRNEELTFNALPQCSLLNRPLHRHMRPFPEINLRLCLDLLIARYLHLHLSPLPSRNQHLYLWLYRHLKSLMNLLSQIRTLLHKNRQLRYLLVARNVLEVLLNTFMMKFTWNVLCPLHRTLTISWLRVY